MASKIFKSLSDSYDMLNEFDEKLKNLKKIVDSCRTSRELENCRGIMESIENQMKNSIDGFLEDNKIANFLSFGELENFLREKMQEKMKMVYDYYHRKITSKMQFETHFEKKQPKEQ